MKDDGFLARARHAKHAAEHFIDNNEYGGSVGGAILGLGILSVSGTAELVEYFTRNDVMNAAYDGAYVISHANFYIGAAVLALSSIGAALTSLRNKISNK